jgi:tetraacyldisaccharide 4'-kinase
MIILRKLLFPFAVLYGAVTGIRNFLFDKGILQSHSFNLPVIAVGNLSVGGTGKSPQIEYLIRLLSSNYKVATLSRGYKRESKGFVLAKANATAGLLGDEPYQFFRKFKNIQVAVDSDRNNGINQLLSQAEIPEVILLDDAYQHRKVKAGMYVLLTAYGDLYATDWMLPTGNLRESRSGADRAAVVVVTKCPPDLSSQEQKEIEEKLKLRDNQQLFFTAIGYDDKVYGEVSTYSVAEILNTEKVLIAGIAKPEPFFNHLKNTNDVCLSFPDHHNFSEKEIEEIKKIAQNKIIITTEKDYVRLQGRLAVEQLYYLPIQTVFLPNATLSGNDFDQTILNYVGTSTRNS